MKTYAIILEGKIVNTIKWDGVSAYSPPNGSIVMLMSDAIDAGYEHAPTPSPVRRVWKTAGDFWAEFTHSEQSLISGSTVPEIRTLVVSLSVWQAEMWSDDPRVQAGFHALIGTGLLTSDRASEILNPPGLMS